MSPWKQIELALIEFFNRLGQMQAPDSDTTLTCPLRRLPKTAKISSHQCPQQPKH